MVCVTWLSPILINGDAFYSLQLPSPQVLKALTIQILELNAKPCELRIYCSKEEITQELKINPVVNLRRLLSYCFLLQWIPSDLERISCLDKSWPPTNLWISRYKQCLSWHYANITYEFGGWPITYKLELSCWEHQWIHVWVSVTLRQETWTLKPFLAKRHSDHMTIMLKLWLFWCVWK